MYTLLYDIKGALHNLRVNGSSAFFAALTTTLTLTFFGLFLLVYHNGWRIIQSLQSDVEISAYLYETVSTKEVQGIRKMLEANTWVASMQYVSKDDARVRFEKQFSGESLLQHLGQNPLPSSFEVKVKPDNQNPKEMSLLAAEIREMPGVEEVEYGTEWLKNFSDFLTVVTGLGIGFGGGLAVAVVTIIAHAIRLHFYDRSEEVEIMKLIGATPRFIKNPFLIEGIFLGLLGGVLSCAALWALFQFVSLRLAEGGGILGQLFTLHFLPPPMIAGLIVTGTILGGIGGELALTYLLRFRTKTVPKMRR